MAAPYTTVTVSGYNDNPPVDDGTVSEENRVKWETIKEKLPDPLKTAIEAIDTNVIAAFLKVIGGGGVTSSAIDATIGNGDQGKLYRTTGAGGITITTPDATSVTSPWVCGFVNNASSAITIDGNGSQTINGAANLTVPVSGGGFLFTDGTNWFMVGLGGVPVGKQLMAGQIINGTITESNTSNAVTYALKTLAGNDPSTNDPVLVCFRNATAATGNYVYRAVTAALSLTIPSTATMGATNGLAFEIWLVLFDDGGTIRLGAINPVHAGKSVYALSQIPLVASSTTIGTGADSAKTFYTDTGVTNKAYAILGVASYPSGLVTAGTWNVSPTYLQLFGSGVLPPNAAQAEMRWIATLSTTSGTEVHQTDLPACRVIVAVLGNVSHNDGSNRTFRVAFSTNNGSSYSTADVITSSVSAATGISGRLDVMNVDRQQNFVLIGIGTNMVASQQDTSFSGLINAIQFSPAAGSFDSGEIVLYGVF